MSIELRQSDVMAQAAQSRKKVSNLALRIFGDVYEAQRVSQVNQGLAFDVRSDQMYDQNLSKTQFEVPLDDVTKGGSTVLKSLGEADWASVEQNFADYVDKKLEYINKNITNRKARKELIQHLQMGAIAHKGRLQQTWRQAAERTAKAGLAELYQTIKVSDAPVEDKETEISSRIDEMVKVGWLYPDEAETLKQEFLKDIRIDEVKRFARKYGYEAGIAELNNNRDYYLKTWELGDDEIDAIIAGLKREWGTQLELEAQKRDAVHKESRLRIAEGIEPDAEQPLTQDELLEMYRADRIDWNEYLRFKGYLDDVANAKIRAAEKAAEAKAKATEEAKKEYEDWLEDEEDKLNKGWKDSDQELKGGVLDIILDPDIPQADRRKQADKMLDDHHGPDEAGDPQIGNTDYKTLKKLNETFNPSRGFTEGKDLIENLYKALIEDQEGRKTELEDTKQLTKEKVDRILEFEEEIRLGPTKLGREYTEDEKIEIAGNIVNKDRAKALDLIENRVFAKGLAGRYFADEMVRDMGAKNQLLGMEEEILLPFSERVIEAYRIRFDKLPNEVQYSIPNGEVYVLDAAGQYYTLYNGKLRIWDNDKEKWVHFKEPK